jgi:hypothetical protein
MKLPQIINEEVTKPNSQAILEIEPVGNACDSRIYRFYLPFQV